MIKKIILLLAILLGNSAASAQFSGIGAPGLGGAIPAGTPSASGCSLPPIAASIGFIKNTFCETWSNGTATIDINNTKAPGFNWYINTVFPAVPFNWWLSELNTFAPIRNPIGNYLTVNNGYMSLNNITPEATDNYGNSVETCVWNGSNVVGNGIFGGGLFVDIVSAFNANVGPANQPYTGPPSNISSGSWPALWGTVTEFLDGSIQAGTNTHMLDFSVMEALALFCTVDNNLCTILMGVHDETSPPNFEVSSNVPNIGPYIVAAFPNFNFQVPHHYSMLWKTIFQGGGIGSFTFYIDGVQMYEMIYSGTGTPTPPPASFIGQYNGEYSEVDNQHLCFFFAIPLSTSNNPADANPLILGTMQVWQLPILYTTAPTNFSAYQGYVASIPGITVTDNSTPSSITVNLQDSSGILSATGSGVTGSGTTNITITGSSTPPINAALNTLTFIGTASDSIAITATDNAGHQAPPNLVTMSVSPPCPQFTSFLARTSGLSTLYQGAYLSMICGLVSDGDMANLDGFYMYVTNSTGSLQQNLVQNAYNLTLHGSCTFVAFGGYTGDGSTCYQDTGFNPATANGNYQLNSASFGACDLSTRNTANANAWTMGAWDGSGTSGNIMGFSPLNSASNIIWAVNSLAVGTGSGIELNSEILSVQGSWAFTRYGAGTPDNAGGADDNIWLNGILSTVGFLVSSSLPNENIMIMTLGQTVPTTDASPDNLGYAWFGSSMVNPVHIYNRAHTFIQTVGGPSGC
jgi:hypothetical protein